MQNVIRILKVKGDEPSFQFLSVQKYGICMQPSQRWLTQRELMEKIREALRRKWKIYVATEACDDVERAHSMAGYFADLYKSEDADSGFEKMYGIRNTNSGEYISSE